MDHLESSFSHSCAPLAKANQEELLVSIRTLLQFSYGLKDIVEIEPIGSYCDLNLLVVTRFENNCKTVMNKQGQFSKFIFKITSLQEDPKNIEFQTAVINHLTTLSKKRYMMPLIIRAVKGSFIEQIKVRFEGEDYQKCVCRLFAFIEGQSLAQIYRPSSKLLDFDDKGVMEKRKQFEICFGTAVGEMAADLTQYKMERVDGNSEPFGYPFSEFRYHLSMWNLTNFRHLDFYLKKIEDVTPARDLAFFRMVHSLMAQRNVIENLLQSDKLSLVHNDAGGSNIVICHQGELQEPTVNRFGILDFGDLMICPRVFEVTMSLARYPIDFKAPLGNDQFLCTMTNVIEGFCRWVDLSQSEKSYIFLLIFARKTVSCVMSKYNNLKKGYNPHVEASYSRNLQSILRILGVECIESKEKTEQRFLQAEQKFMSVLAQKELATVQ